SSERTFKPREDSKPYERKPFVKEGERAERTFKPREDSKPYERKPFDRDSRGDSSERTFKPREETRNSKPETRNSFERKPFNKEGGSSERSYKPREETRNFNPRHDNTDRPKKFLLAKDDKDAPRQYGGGGERPSYKKDGEKRFDKKDNSERPRQENRYNDYEEQTSEQGEERRSYGSRTQFDDREKIDGESQGVERLVYEEVTFVATTLEGLEELLATELRNIGASEVNVVTRGVEFKGDKRILYRANLELRTAIRVLVPIASFRVRHESGLYGKVKQINWEEYMTVKDTLAINSSVHSSYFTHSQYVALKAKDAIVDQFREKYDFRPNVDTYAPKLRVNIHIHEDQCTVLLDSSNESLHKRGYRSESFEAPLNEVLAAGMVLLSGWDCKGNFMDPMCGSGTLVTEAAMIAYNVPPMLKRTNFGFMHWKDYDATLWEDVLETAKKNIKTEFPYKIIGSDKDYQAVRIAMRNIEEAGFTDKIEIERRRLEIAYPPEGAGTVIINPPYDERLEIEDINGLYKLIGDRFKTAFKNHSAWILSGNEEAMKNVGLKTSKRLTLNNGGIECKFWKYDLYEGSKKIGKEAEEHSIEEKEEEIIGE
ncbi:MAG: hypothetical protein RLZZ292_1464, partial [Bacteroidota bacterium]